MPIRGANRCRRRNRVAGRSPARGVVDSALPATTREPDFSASIRDLEVEVRPVAALQPAHRNARIHSKAQVRQIVESIEIFGWTNPILIDAEGKIIAGHGRFAAAKQLGLDRVPTIRIDDMSEAQRRAYIIADNKLAERAGWNREVLALELRDLLEMELGFEITTTGFEMGEIDLLMRELDDRDDDEADDLSDADLSARPVSKPGDLWLLGEHRVLCGDARNPECLLLLMGGRLAQMVFTDPPYNVPIEGHVSGLGSVRHAEFAIASGEMTEVEFITFLQSAVGLMAAHSADGAIHFICIDWRHLFELLTAGRGIYRELKNLCVWTKTNGGMGSLYRSQHELIAVFKKGSARHINNVELGRHGRSRTNVWAYPGMNSFGANRDALLAVHPTVKPVALVEDAILDCSLRGGIVLDPFLGSGTTLIAAERTGRRGFGLELEPRYVDVTLRRLRKFTGIEPSLAATGAAFTEVETRGS